MTPLAQAAGTDLAQWIRDAGAIGILAMGIVAFVRGVIVRGKDLERAIAAGEAATAAMKERAEIAERDRDRYIDLAFKLASTSERAVDTVREITADREAGR